MYNFPYVVTVFFLGLSSGVSFSLINSTLNVWFCEAGISNAGIGYLSLVSIPYALKFFFVSFFEARYIPIITKYLGFYRGWLFIIQLCVILSTLVLGFQDPSQNLFYTVLSTLVISLFASCQDILSDAYRIHYATQLSDVVDYGTTAAAVGHKLGMLISGFGGIYLSHYLSFCSVCQIMMLPTLVSAIVVVIAPHKAITHTEEPYKVSCGSTSVHHFLSFFKRTNWYRILVFIFLFKTVSVAIDTMIIPLSIEQGLSRLCIAKHIKFWGTLSLLTGNLVGGYILYRISISQGLLLWGIAQTLISLFLVFQFVLWRPYPEYFVLFSILERFCCGIGRITLMVYQSKNCSKENLMADAALLTSFGSYVRIMISVITGWVVGRVDWVYFFIIIAFLSLLTLTFISKLLTKNPYKNGGLLSSQWGL